MENVPAGTSGQPHKCTHAVMKDQVLTGERRQKIHESFLVGKERNQ